MHRKMVIFPITNGKNHGFYIKGEWMFETFEISQFLLIVLLVKVFMGNNSQSDAQVVLLYFLVTAALDQF